VDRPKSSCFTWTSSW